MVSVTGPAPAETCRRSPCGSIQRTRPATCFKFSGVIGSAGGGSVGGDAVPDGDLVSPLQRAERSADRPPHVEGDRADRLGDDELSAPRVDALDPALREPQRVVDGDQGGSREYERGRENQS